MKIGVFDSGLGGLTILKELFNELPQFNYIYLGDNARVPYGNRSPEIIYEFTRQAVNFLLKKDCKLVIIACNTSTTTSLKRIQQEFLPKFYPDRRVLGVVKPVVEEMAEKKHKRIGVIGTKATVNSEAFVREIKKILPESEVFQAACPLLVPFIEDGAKNKKILDLILREYLEDIIKKNIDGLILACTHYELLKKEIGEVVGSKVEVISEGKIVAKKLKEYFVNHPEIEKKLEKHSGKEFFVTDLNPDYERLMELFLDHHWKEGKLRRVNL
jgi:glutamate racemase